MDGRKEYTKKLSFSSENDLKLFEGIVKTHRSDIGNKNDGDFVLYLLKEKYMPSNTNAYGFCENLYSMNKDKKKSSCMINEFSTNGFKVLEDLFAHLASNLCLKGYKQNYELIHKVALIMDNDWTISEDVKTLKKALYDLKAEVTKTYNAKKIQKISGIKGMEMDKDTLDNLVKKESFNLTETSKVLLEGYYSFYTYPLYYVVLSQLCKQVSLNNDISTKDRYELIRIIKNMSKNWEASS